MSNIDERKRIVIWSGGYDSTLCLYRELKKHNYVEAWSFVWDEIDSIKTKCERKVQKEFKKKIKHLGKINHKIIKIEHNSIVPYGYTVMQAALFLPTVTYLAPNNSTIVWGFVWKDDFWYYCDRFEGLRQMQCGVMHKDVVFEYPLISTKKYEVIKEIENLQLSDCVWTCESPISFMKSCGECEPCITRKLAKEEQKIRSSIGKNDRKG